MKNIYFLKLNKLKDSSNTAQSTLARYFINNLSLVNSMTIDTIAENTNTSYSTVCRFFKGIGFSGFKEFKKTVLSELDKAASENNIFSEDFLSFSEFDSVETIGKRIRDFTIDVIDNGYKSISKDKIKHIHECFNKAEHIHFFGLGTSSVSAQYAYIKFFRLKSGCSFSSDIVVSKMTASLLRKNDILFLFSSSGRTKPIIEAAKLAKEQGAKIITISDFGNSPLHNVSHINICTTIRDINKYLDSDFPLIQSQIVIIDILHKYIFLKSKSKAEENFDKTVTAVRKDKLDNEQERLGENCD
ncbi:MAG: MurR/RpiR family transcriptional regulator [Clostridia bacterium]|nr:MurR/RpiR family transcriptional regulator [Clostridia bacterium]